MDDLGDVVQPSRQLGDGGLEVGRLDMRLARLIIAESLDQEPEIGLVGTRYQSKEMFPGSSLVARVNSWTRVSQSSAYSGPLGA